MKKEDWEKAKDLLCAPPGQVRLLCDGYNVTLVNECIGMFRNGIKVYIDNMFHGAWLVSDCEVRRRFISQKETPVMKRKWLAAYNKMSKREQKQYKELYEATRTVYQSHWTNWQALVKHFESNNADIRLVTTQ